ncbi:MAG: hypothetical protein IPK71_25940 [Myxococcales bacterium]|nr:hypothetical protein [Myxococcales bacterium]
MLQGALIGLIVALAMFFWQKRQAKLGTGLAGAIEGALVPGEPLTLGEIASRVGKASFLGRGEVAQSLNALHAVGKVRIHPAPEGTPQLQKVDHIRYERIA